MRTISSITVLCIFIWWLSGCKSASEGAFDQASNIAISWELTDNFAGPNDVFEAKFYLKNNGSLTLSDSAWALFFNMAPRPLTPTPTPQLATLEHINGDWYKLSPNKGFRLAPGDSVAISYRGTAVSYTHLDVYKRQINNSGSFVIKRSFLPIKILTLLGEFRGRRSLYCPVETLLLWAKARPTATSSLTS